MKLKNVFLMGLSFVLVAAIAIGGTLAYLTDTDSDVNVMTMGKISIAQHEYERVVDENGNPVKGVLGEDFTENYGITESYKLQEFTQAKPALPAVYTNDAKTTAWDEFQQLWNQVGAPGSNDLFDDSMKNVVDKFVFVENTGKTDAYYRTIIAIETPEGIASGIIHTSFNSNNRFNAVEQSDDFSGEADKGTKSYKLGYVNIDGVRYGLYEMTYNEVLKPGEVSRPSLLQVYLDPKTTNEDCAKFGNTWDILVLSQAVQAKGFTDAQTALDTAFGTSAENAVEWFSGISVPVGYPVSDNAELAAAIETGETEIWLNPGTYHAPAAAKGKTLIINGTKDAILEIVPAGQGEANGQLDYNFDGSTVTFNGITIKTNSNVYAGYARLSGTYNNCIIQNTYNLGTGNSAFYNCEINITNDYLRVGGAYKAVFDSCTFNTDGRALLVFQDGTKVDQTVTVKDCTFNATNAAKTWNGIHVAAVSIDGSQGGTYVVNLKGTNTVDSDFNGLTQIKAQLDPANVTIVDE